MDLVTGPIRVLVSKVLQLLEDEYHLQAGLEKEVQSLSKELELMHAALSVVAQVRPEELPEPAKLWVRDSRETSYNIEDILDTFLVRVDGDPQPVVRDRVRRQSLLSKMAHLCCLGGKVIARHEIATKIVDLTEQLKEMYERRVRCGVDHLVPSIPASTPTSDPRNQALYNEASELVGIDEPRDAVTEMLDDKSNKKIKIVSIFGSGGLGKTTLAKAVYDKVYLQFDCWAFVPVGQNPDEKKVLRDILIDLTDNEVAKEKMIDDDKRRYTVADLMVFDVLQLRKRLREFLKGKRYLIVVDDIWDIEIWEVTIKPAFVETNRGSRIIATARMHDVAERVGEPYGIQELSHDCSKKLLSKIIFGREDKLDNDEMADKILDKCHGVPLAITAIASLLDPLKQKWPRVYDSIFLKSNGFEPEKNLKVNNAMRILSFSYYHLPSHLRTCMLYLRVFPEDEYVDKNMLIWRWIAEGLVQKEEGEGLFEVGDRYFRELINRSLIQPSTDGGILRGCRVHDFVLRLISKLSSEENFVSVLDSKQQSVSHAPGVKVRRVAMHSITDTENSRPPVEVDDSIDMAAVRSFNALFTNMVPPVDKFEVLRVLALEYCWVDEGDYLKLIGKLRHLRYLGLTGTRIRELPEKVGDLKFLQTLMLHETGIKQLPKSLQQLTQLMCLRCDEKTRVPEWIGKLTSLVELQVYPGAEGKCFVEEFGKLKHIRVLNTEINLQDEGEARGFLESLSKLEEAESIVVSSMRVIRLMEAVKPSLVLNCKNVSVLDLTALIFPRRPACINPEDLPMLNRLCLCVGVLEQQDMEILGSFQELLDMSISGPVPDGCDGIIVSSDAGFEKLVTLSCSANIKFVAGAMPRLETIKLTITVRDVFNAWNHVVGLGLGNIYSLQLVTVIIVCSNCILDEVEEMEEAMRHQVDDHPNWPKIHLRRYDEDGMATTSLSDRWRMQELQIGIGLIHHVNLRNQLITEVEDAQLVCHEPVASPRQDNDLMSIDSYRYQWTMVRDNDLKSKIKSSLLEKVQSWEEDKAKIHKDFLQFEPDRKVHQVKENVAAMQQFIRGFTVETLRLGTMWEILKTDATAPVGEGE